MLQLTSLIAHADLIAKDRLGPDEREVLAILKQHPEGLTDREITQALGGPSFGWVPSRVSARRNGIIDRCTIARPGWTVMGIRRACRVTGRRALAWRIVQGNGSQLRFGF